MKRTLLFTLLTVALCLPAWSAVKGDLNGDGVVDVSDVNMMIDMVLGKASYNSAGDLNGDGIIDVSDVNTLIDVVLGKAVLDDDVPIGVYMGIIGFNDRLTTYPMALLNSRTQSGFTSFIDGLTTRKGTVLYWATDNSLTMLDQAPSPVDLSKVVLVTFTDGLDQGSMMYNDAYATNEAYAKALQQRIGKTYKGLPLDAYCIGLRGSDVTDVTQFRTNLRQLASSDGNALEVTDMSEVNSRLNAIADHLTQVTKKQDLSLTIPGQADGTRVRFTFDDVSDAANSSLYIEGTFNLSDRSLRSVTYRGMTSTSGATVKGKQDGIFVTYQFLNTRRMVTGEILPMGYIRQWSYVTSSGKWQRNSEFTPDTDTEVTVTNTSALVVLNLDCSSSLGSQISTIKSYAKDFVTKMAAIVPPPPVINVSPTELSFNGYVGETYTNTIWLKCQDLEGPVEASITRGGEVLSVSPTTISQSNATYGVSLTVTYKPTYSGSTTGVLTLTSEKAQKINVPITCSAVFRPEINVSSNALTFDGFVNETSTQTISLSGLNLQGDVTATVSSGSGVFSVSPASISKSSATSGVTLTVSYNPTAAGTTSGKITLSSQNAQPVTVTLSGVAVKRPELSVTPTELTFEGYVGRAYTKTVSLKGLNMQGDVTATVTSGADVFSVSPTAIAKSSASSGATVSVTYSPTAVGTHCGVLRLTSENAQPVMVTLAGTAQEWPPGPANATVFTVNGVSFKMVGIEGGTFTMGATAEQGSDAYDNEKPAHQVTLSSFAIGATEVTQELWVAVMGSNPSSFTGDLQRPVEKVSWNDCQTFITKLNALTGKTFRLPTEAEWEYAARGGKNSQGYKYAGSNTIGDVAWYTSNSNSQTHAVATKAPNELGLYDMSGNVWEWCQDWYGSYSSSAQTDPTGPSSGSYRVSRGGSWIDYAGSCRVSYRCWSVGSRNFDLGLRLAL